MIVLAASVIATPALAAMGAADPACSQPLLPGAERRAATTGACRRTPGQRRAPRLGRPDKLRPHRARHSGQPAGARFGPFVPASLPQLASVARDQLEAHIGLHERRLPPTRRATDADILPHEVAGPARAAGKSSEAQGVQRCLTARWQTCHGCTFATTTTAVCLSSGSSLAWRICQRPAIVYLLRNLADFEAMPANLTFK